MEKRTQRNAEKVLARKRVAILVSDGFEEIELTDPKRALEEAGAETYLIAPHHGSVRSWHDDSWSKSYKVDFALEECDAVEFDALVLPGGVKSPDTLRMD